MALINVAEFTGANPTYLPAARTPKLTSQDVAVGASSAQSTAFAAGTNLIRVCADVACYIDIGPDPTAAVGDIYLAAGAAEYFSVAPGDKLAVIEV